MQELKENRVKLRRMHLSLYLGLYIRLEFYATFVQSA